MRELETVRFLLLIDQLGAEEGSERAAARRLGIDESYPAQLRKHEHRNVGRDALKKSRKALRLQERFFTDPSLGPTPNFHDFVGVREEQIEYDEPDTAAWLELEANGTLDHYRRQGVTEAQIEHTRRAKWDGVPRPRDYERLLEAYLLGPRPEPAAAREAREAVEAEGGPRLKDHV